MNSDQPLDTSLSQEILEIAHRWYQPLLAFLLGCLVGWVVSSMYPISYRAETRISVAYNADAVFSHPDDLKNWQMYQLDALVLSPDVLAETLERLRANDSYWESVSEVQLREMVHASWRNTGVWRLSAIHPEEYRAANLAYNWMRVTLEKYWAASQAAGQLQGLESQIAALDQVLASQQLVVSGLGQSIYDLVSWQDNLTQAPADQAPGDPARLQILVLAGQAQDVDPALKELVGDYPDPSSNNTAYLEWLGRLLPVLQSRLANAEMQSNALQNQKDRLAQEYNAARDRSRGLSTLLVVTPMLDGIWQIETIRQTGLMALVGGLLGVLGWASYWLVRLSLKKRRSPR
jgi:hypothetical protein